VVNAHIQAVDYWLPESTLTNADLSAQFPEWSVDKIASKTGIDTRHIVAAGDYSSDLATRAAQQLFSRLSIDPLSIDFVIVCTQSPDFYMPSTAGIVQHNLGLRHGVGATDMNLGCSGFIYALGLSKGLIETGIAQNVLVLTVDTYSRFVNGADKSVRTLFGDGAAATLISGGAVTEALRGFVYGTDGTGAGSLIVPNGGLRDGTDVSPQSDPAARGLQSNGYDLFMDGPAIFNFTLEVVPPTVEKVLGSAGLEASEIDLFVFHQANAFMLEHLRKKLGIDEQRFYVSMSDTGNTVSSTIPIALVHAEREGKLVRGMKVMLVGFGVGLSWGGLVVTW
jgi:3-oxoacyl-[acyl-carrier-protein] synthase-3